MMDHYLNNCEGNGPKMNSYVEAKKSIRQIEKKQLSTTLLQIKN
jgi:hypothetical protein